jgi:hypothetical protein
MRHNINKMIVVSRNTKGIFFVDDTYFLLWQKNRKVFNRPLNFWEHRPFKSCTVKSGVLLHKISNLTTSTDGRTRGTEASFLYKDISILNNGVITTVAVLAEE